MMELLTTDDCLEVMREARNSHWVSELQRLRKRITSCFYVFKCHYRICNNV